MALKLTNKRDKETDVDDSVRNSNHDDFVRVKVLASDSVYEEEREARNKNRNRNKQARVAKNWE